jgi:hypothetical protein
MKQTKLKPSLQVTNKPAIYRNGMSNKNITKICDKYQDLKSTIPLNEEQKDYQEKELANLIFIINKIFQSDVELLFKGCSFFEKFEKLSNKGKSLLEKGYTCEVTEEGKFKVLKHDLENCEFELLSPIELVKQVSNGIKLTDQQLILAELLLADELNFVIMNLVIRI